MSGGRGEVCGQKGFGRSGGGCLLWGGRKMGNREKRGKNVGQA